MPPPSTTPMLYTTYDPLADTQVHTHTPPFLSSPRPPPSQSMNRPPLRPYLQFVPSTPFLATTLGATARILQPVPQPPFFRARRRMQRPPTAAQLLQDPTASFDEQSGQVRVRQHVNPLARRWSQPTRLPSTWFATAFEHPHRPLVIDLGVAKGRFLLKLARQDASRNFLGLEIRHPLVLQANRVASDARLRNLFYVSCNVNVSFAGLLSGVPAPVVREIYVQFCDPWFKKRHAKRRMVNRALVDDMYKVLKRAYDHDEHRLDRRVFVQTDVAELAHEIVAIFDHHPAFQRLGNEHGFRQDPHGWLVENPTGVATEREIAVANNGGCVYRALFRLVPTSTSSGSHLTD